MRTEELLPYKQYGKQTLLTQISNTFANSALSHQKKQSDSFCFSKPSFSKTLVPPQDPEVYGTVTSALPCLHVISSTAQPSKSLRPLQRI